MIATLHGILQKKIPPYLLIDVNGIGYELQAPMTTFYKLPAEQEKVLLHTHLVIREDAQQLYGFAAPYDRDLFRILIKVNGVGPKLALSILSGIAPSELVQAIQQHEVSGLVNIPGIGKKTAQRLIMDCQDAIQSLMPIDGNPQSKQKQANTQVQDAIDALTSLGYKPLEAKKSIEGVYQSGQNTQEMIRQALQSLVGS